VQLTVTQGNVAAVRLYERCGFTVYGVEPLAIRVGLMQNSLKPRFAAPHLLVFAADHGLAVEGIAMPGQGARAARPTHETVRQLLTNQLPLTAFEAGRDVATPDQHYWIDWTPFTYPFNMTRQPAASVPIGLHSDGLPMAAQLVGPLYADRLVLRAARAVESARPWKLPAT
jgi:hypothetical protein